MSVRCARGVPVRAVGIAALLASTTLLTSGCAVLAAADAAGSLAVSTAATAAGLAVDAAKVAGKAVVKAADTVVDAVPGP